MDLNKIIHEERSPMAVHPDVTMDSALDVKRSDGDYQTSSETD